MRSLLSEVVLILKSTAKKINYTHYSLTTWYANIIYSYRGSQSRWLHKQSRNSYKFIPLIILLNYFVKWAIFSILSCFSLSLYPNFCDIMKNKTLIFVKFSINKMLLLMLLLYCCVCTWIFDWNFKDIFWKMHSHDKTFPPLPKSFEYLPT